MCAILLVPSLSVPHRSGWWCVTDVAGEAIIILFLFQPPFSLEFRRQKHVKRRRLPACKRARRQGDGGGHPRAKGNPGGACGPTPTSSTTPTGILAPRNGPSILNPRAYLQRKGSTSTLKGWDAWVGNAGMGWIPVLVGGQVSRLRLWVSRGLPWAGRLAGEWARHCD